jgi:hypothetical protein
MWYILGAIVLFIGLLGFGIPCYCCLVFSGRLDDQSERDAYSGPCRTLIPADSGHLFRSIPAGHSDSFRTLIPEHSGHF